MWEGGNCSVLGLGPSELNILGGDRPDCTCVNMNMVVTQRDTLEDQTAGRRWPGSRGSLSGKVGAGMSAGLVGGSGSALGPMGAKGPLSLRKSGVWDLFPNPAWVTGL